jgi:COMPASS component BRE2
VSEKKSIYLVLIPLMNESFQTDDVIGLHIHIPEDVSQPMDMVRDRIPIRYVGQLYFETLDYVSTKPMEELILTTNMKNGEEAKFVPAVIPGSFISTRTAMRLYSVQRFEYFLPPTSKFQQKMNARDTEDGHAVYYPVITWYKG